MKARLDNLSLNAIITILAVVLGSLVLGGLATCAESAFAQQPKIFSDSVTKAKPDPNALTLTADDQKQLDLINDRLGQLKPQLDAAKKQQEVAQSQLNEANSFIAQYNQADSIRMAFLFRIAADVCGCKTSELEFSTDGKSVIRKKPDAPNLVTAPVTTGVPAAKAKP